MNRRRVELTCLVVGILALVMLAMSLRTHLLEEQLIHVDELANIQRLEMDAEDRWKHPFAVRQALYYGILSAVTSATGQKGNPYVARWLSLVVGVLTVPVLVLLGRRLFSVEVGLLAGLWFTTSPSMIQSAQLGRVYSLLILWLLVATWMFARLYEVIQAGHPSTRLAMAYAVVAGFGAVLHLHGALVVGAHLLLAVTQGLRVPAWRRPFAVATALTCLAMLPAVWILFEARSVYWGEAAMHAAGNNRADFGRYLLYTVWVGKPKISLAILVATFGAVLLWLVAERSGDRARVARDRFGLVLVSLIGAGVLLLLEGSSQAIASMQYSRYAWLAVPGLLLVSAAALHHACTRILGLLSTALAPPLAALALATGWLMIPKVVDAPPCHSFWPPTYETLEAIEARDGEDAVVTVPRIPQWHGNELARLTGVAIKACPRPEASCAAQIERLLERHDHVWLVLDSRESLVRARQDLSKELTIVDDIDETRGCTPLLAVAAERRR